MPTLTKNASSNFVTAVVLIVLTSIAVIIRFLVNVYRRKLPDGPDWLCLFGTAVFNAYCGIIINFIFNVSQHHAFDLDLSYGMTEAVNLVKRTYFTELLFGLGITSIKLSILWFYFQLFSVNRILNPVIKATAAVCVLWFIVATLVIIFQCKPVQAYWEHLGQPPYCLEYPRVLLGYEITNLFIDVAILCIPTTTLWTLKLPFEKKLPVMGIFLIGAVVCIFSILRLAAIWHPPDIIVNFDFNKTSLYSTLQLGLAIITSCLPTYSPLLSLVPQIYRYLRGYVKTIHYHPTTIPTQDRHNIIPSASKPERSWIRVGDDRLDTASSQAWAYSGDSNSGGSGGSSNNAQYALGPMRSSAIVVNTRVDVV
ncbi:hypothetical protein F4861DRAFT_321535 [Xylaria intraflava]|nr:hypothetical protein F4861DRAFT_321535 [Xylaria intraflava]